jgi:hypothetical protein
MNVDQHLLIVSQSTAYFLERLRIAQEDLDVITVVHNTRARHLKTLCASTRHYYRSHPESRHCSYCGASYIAPLIHPSTPTHALSTAFNAKVIAVSKIKSIVRRQKRKIALFRLALLTLRQRFTWLLNHSHQSIYCQEFIRPSCEDFIDLINKSLDIEVIIL